MSDFDYLSMQAKYRQDAIRGRYDRTQGRLCLLASIAVGLVMGLYLMALGF